jgi:cbb3-type cytochrome oxidase subunit 3
MHSTHHNEQGAMWINMNEETLIAITGIMLVIVFTLPFIAIPVIAYKVYQKHRVAREKKRLEAQAGSTQQEPTMSTKPASPRRTMIIFIGWTLVVALWGLMVGFTVGVISNLIYIVFVFPFVLGINSGKMIADLIRKAKIRKTSQLVILSLVSAIAIYGALHYGRYLGFQIRASLEISSGLSEALEEQNLSVAKALVDYALREETGHSGFLGYMLYRANEGVSIGRLSRSSSLNLGPVLTWLYWALEFAIILGLTIQKGRKLVSASFCESCGNWYGREKHLGGTASANESFLLDLIRQKDFSGLGKLIEKNAEVPSLEVYFQGCEVCGKSPSQLVVRRAFQGAKGGLQFGDASQTILQPTESSLLLSQLSFSGD